MSCATFLFAKSVSLGIPCKVLLIDFGLEPTTKNMDWLRNQVNGLISLYGNGSDTDLSDETRTMLSNLIIRMAYDNLCINT